MARNLLIKAAINYSGAIKMHRIPARRKAGGYHRICAASNVHGLFIERNIDWMN